VERFGTQAKAALDGFARVLPESESWQVKALAAARDWPEKGLDSLDPLKEAVERQPDQALWAALLVEALTVGGRDDEATHVGKMVGGADLSPRPHRLRLELDLLEVSERQQDAGTADTRWQSLWESLAEASPERRALASQRRALILVRREALEDAARLLLHAAELWESTGKYRGEASEAFFAWRAALELSGIGVGAHATEDPVGAAITFAKHPESEAADEREAGGLRAQAMERYADARALLWQAYVLRRRRGGLFDSLRLLRELGHLHTQAGENAAAVALFVACGAERPAEQTARHTPGQEVVRGLELGGPRWERSASYAALGARGSEAPVKFVEEWVDRVFEDAEQPWFSIVSPQPALRARNALAALFCAVPPKKRERALRQLRQDAISGFIGTSREATRALGMSMSLGWSDESETLVEALLREGLDFVSVSLDTLVTGIKEHARLRTELQGRGVQGHRAALTLLAHSGEYEGDPELGQRCTEVAAAVQPSTVHRDEHVTSVDIVRFDDVGVIGRCADESTRSTLASNLAALAASDEEPLTNRRSAVEALFNLAPAVGSADDPEDVAERLAEGRIGSSPWDMAETDHPFSSFRVTVPDQKELQAAALRLVGRWRELGRAQQLDLDGLVLGGLLTQHPAVAAAALETLTRVPYLRVDPRTDALSNHADARVRAGLATLMTEPSRFDATLALRLASDSNGGVRSRLLGLDANRPEGREVLETLRRDADSYIRAKAQQVLSTS